MRTILFVLALLGATVGRGQIVLDWYSSAAPVATLLLDDYPNAAAAYSLRLLRTGYTGNCIEVRRSSDNTTQNIGFAGGVLDTVTLKNFCSGTDCFVRTWYDQSGNVRNGLQTILANQPRIVTSGVILRINQQPAILYDGSNDAFSLSIPAPSTFTSVSQYAVVYRVSSGQPISTLGNRLTSNLYNGWLLTDNRMLVREGTTFNDMGTVTTAGQMLWAMNRKISTTEMYINNILINDLGSPSLSTNAYTDLGSSAAVTNGYHQEIIMWGINQSTNRTGIQSNINAFYNIY